MKIYTINQKMSGTGNIHDIASEQVDRDIKFKAGTKYAVVLSSFYGGNLYTTHKTLVAAQIKHNNISESSTIIDTDGHDVNCEY